ncbi:tRNA-dihydrouridine(20a/20b) synthase [NAD(P)+]-like [Diorhabda carinulata]|uniref:tRNA-dihydrouridine(20a/20b) synthase [NAD(P)+]-like n=1 Tax=Diorhabda carinulata TaxID=1163345 RepID=UPI0025A0382C|nr:tRNA-dihydrouridine(20a/20b) synthase [NAD(P)+]-like [Diorhabda carinulata]
MSTKSDKNIVDLFRDKKMVKICAPMVRYSKLQFRNLVKLYDCDLTFTPMILADSFCQSEKARRNEFKTNSLDDPLVIQFAANTVHDFVGAAYLAAPYCNGVDLNCGCPQKWAKDQELGCEILKKPELLYDIVRQCRNRIPKPFSVSVKMRLLYDIKETVEICRQLEKCDVSFLTVHARYPQQSVGEINRDALRLIRENCDKPVVGNGGITTLEDCFKLHEYTGCSGVMVANGILTNPTLFANNPLTTIDCVQNWLDICYNSTITLDKYAKEQEHPSCTIPERPPNLIFQCFHHHLVFMLEKLLPRKKRQYFNNLKTFSSVLQFLDDTFCIRPRLFEPEKFLKYLTLNLDYSDRHSMYENLKPNNLHIEDVFSIYDPQNTDGKYFSTKTKSENCDWSDIFLENG